ncbi:hypothetical protein L596_002396 [Steinernema carpocapsae]|uniref:Uncharacterized protein n=1 Tax=Steinernema carpocapsae TaxID=34508 RepID=A0A4U8URW0_STECR|nr:hypothetical protein L596_002396 [Steinernema carpocapsae]
MDSLPSEFADDVKTLIVKEVLQMDFWEHRGGKTSQMFAKKLLLFIVPVSDTRCLYKLRDGNEELELCQPTWDAYRVSLICVNKNNAHGAEGLEMDSKEFRILRNFISKSLRPIDLYFGTDAVSPVILSLLNSVPRFFHISARRYSLISEIVCSLVRAQALSDLILSSCNITGDFLSFLQTFIENCNFNYIAFTKNPFRKVGDVCSNKLVDLLQEKALDFARKGKFVVLRVDRSISKFWEGVEYYFEKEDAVLSLYVSPTLDKLALTLPASMKKRKF